MKRLAFVIAAVTAMGTAHAQVNWSQDLRSVQTALESSHPNFYAHLDREAFRGAAATLERDLGNLTDAEVIVRLAGLVAMGKDGHTRLTLPVGSAAKLFPAHRPTEPPRVALFGQYPLRLSWTSDGYVVVAASPDRSDLLGARLVAIDGNPVAIVMQRLLPVIHGDNIHQQEFMAPSFMVTPEVLAALGVARSGLESKWRFEGAGGRPVEATLHRRSSEEGIAWRRLEGRAADEPPQSITRHESGVLVVRVAEVAERMPGDFARFADALEQVLAAEPPRALLVDLRGNGGGDNSLIDPLVRVLVRAKALWAPGRLFVATDGHTFSAAIQLTSALVRWTPAILIGTPTAGAPNHHGDAQRIILPSSGLTLRVSSVYWQTTDQNDQRDSISPLIDAPPTVMSLRRAVDPVLTVVTAAVQDADAPPSGAWRGHISFGKQRMEARMTLGEGILLEIPDARLPPATLTVTRCEGADIAAQGQSLGYPISLSARRTRAGLLGHVELRGRLYPVAMVEAGP
jgi:hypothetical protein